jgi:signal transduction histidine kinase
MQLTVGVALSVASAVVSFAVAAFAHRRSAPGTVGLAAFSVAAGVWAAGNAVQVAVATLDAKLLAVDVQYVGILVIPLAWFVFAAEYTGREEWVNRRTLAALSVFPVVMFALVLTNDHHHLVRVSATLEETGGVVRISREFGPMFWVATAYSNLVNSVGTVMLVVAALRVGGQYRRQTAAVLVGTSVPWLANVADMAGTTTIEPEAFFGVTAVAFAHAMLAYDLFELLPVARDRVFAELDDGVVVVDKRGVVADYNDAAQRLLGTHLATGSQFRETAPPAIARALEAGDDDPVEIVAGGETRWLTVQSNLADDDTSGRLVLLRDVTELQRKRTELDRENERLERVADTISHDLRNPLSVADGYLDLAEERGDPEDFERVRNALDRMDDIIDGTLRLARTGLSDPDVRDVALADVVERAWANVPTEAAELVVDGGVGDSAARSSAPRSDAVHVVRADPDQLESLLENVFRNAVEHGARSDAGDAPAITVTVGATPKGFFVADDGRGIPERDRGDVFERGFTTSDSGTGLGLAIVLDMAEAHGWQAALSDSDEGGARLDVTGVETVADAPRERTD